MQRTLIPVAIATIESSETSTKVKIPEQYQEFADIISKAKANGLPPHRSYDCAIDLIPGTTPPKGRIYPLLQAEQDAKEEYVKEALEQKYIVPSISPASAGFFFVENKRRGLCSCIDYQGLNEIMIKYPYPLRLVPSTLEQLCSACICTKLDLHSAYCLICIHAGSEQKTAFSMTAGHYNYQVMPYGLACTQSVFQCQINEVLRECLNKLAIAYINGILIYSKSLEQHVMHVRTEV